MSDYISAVTSFSKRALLTQRESGFPKSNTTTFVTVEYTSVDYNTPRLQGVNTFQLYEGARR